MTKKKEKIQVENLSEGVVDAIQVENLSEGVVDAIFAGEVVISESNDITRELYDKTRYGEPFDDKKFQYSLVEALYLIERGKLRILDEKGKSIDFEKFIRKTKKSEPNFWTRYAVFRDLRKRGYIIKTALKFGADFRVYDRGVKPGEDHAKWVVFPVFESDIFTWYEMGAKNRVAHSTRKRLLLGIVDAESDVTYLEVRWLRP